MPIMKAAFKHLRQTKKRTGPNKKKKDAIKDLRKKIQKFLAEKKVEDAKKLAPSFFKAVDKAAKTHTIAKNRASRLKSRLMATIKKAGV